DRKLVRRLIGDPAKFGKKSLRLIERMHDQTGKNLGAKRMKPELERGHDAKIAAPASQRPEEVRALRFADPHELALRGDQVGRHEIVDRQSEFPRRPAEAAPKREARDAGGRVDAER